MKETLFIIKDEIKNLEKVKVTFRKQFLFLQKRNELDQNNDNCIKLKYIFCLEIQSGP